MFYHVTQFRPKMLPANGTLCKFATRTPHLSVAAKVDLDSPNTSRRGLKAFIIAITFAAIWLANATTLLAQQRNGSTSTWSDRALDGVLLPYHNVEIATTETGIIKEILIKPGDVVAIGQPLAVLHSESIEAQLNVKEIEASRVGKINQARAELELQQSKYTKLSKLFENGKVSNAEIERCKAELIIAEGHVQSEEDALKIVEADLRRCRQMLEDRTIIAPRAGIITEVNRQVGEFVAANAPVVARLVDVAQLRATFSVQENELLSITKGSAIRVQVSSGQIVEGIVEFIPPVADPETGWFMINVVIDNSDNRIIGSRCQRIP